MHRSLSRIRIAAVVVVTTAIVAGRHSSAQVVAPGFWYRGPVGIGLGMYTGDPYFPYGYGYGYGGVSSIESMNRGMADVIRAQGEYEQARAKANVDQEIARKQYLENKQQWLQIRREQQRDALARREESKAQTRASNERYVASRKAAQPDRLSLDQFDPSTGKIVWPTALESAPFAKQRTTLESLFQTRAQSGNTTDLSRDAYAAVRAMQDLLKQQINELAADEYIAARNFLDGLAYEARVPSA